MEKPPDLFFGRRKNIWLHQLIKIEYRNSPVALYHHTTAAMLDCCLDVLWNMFSLSLEVMGGAPSRKIYGEFVFWCSAVSVQYYIFDLTEFSVFLKQDIKFSQNARFKKKT